ncbi:sulfotransferase [Simiduia curdlanivorans]|uniref:Tetratricopeptide repeat-containing sulfotransferase family protein n=1 Tax=Simiduia curdlanivorans TaxID=1492769 RepID=A0ABV8V951_9GAMM|nr:tetratricopeptide repeat-containing sulfotransferase family protein [Simiduia curdlanivorans]MDN3638468.1 sulfotransferase [Simiduia curdlanivorans]
MDTQVEWSALLAQSRQAMSEQNWPRLNQCCKAWLSRWPNHSEGHFLAGVLAGQSERYQLAARAFERALSLDEQRCDAAVHLARCLVRTAEHGRAAELVRIASPDIQSSAFLLDLAGSVLTHVGCHLEALPYFTKAVQLKPSNPHYLSNLSACALFNGEMLLARDSLLKNLELRPKDARAWWQLSRLKQSAPEVLSGQICQFLSSWSEPQDLAYANYGLGKLAEDVDDWVSASRYYQAAAAQAKLIAPPYNQATESALVSAIIKHYDASWLAQAKLAAVKINASDETNPLFIVGLPRTGTTLVDAVLCAHSAVSGAGELQFLGVGVKSLSGVLSADPINADIMTAMAGVNADKLAERYWRESNYLGRLGRYRTDKLPFNYYYLGLIAAAFPRGKIVHLTRHPLDACFAIYKQLFAGAYAFSYNLDELAEYYLGYHRLMAHWRSLLGDRLVEVSYENLVANPEEEIRSLLVRLDLPFESACLNFHQQKNTVATASAAQVREKPHTRSVGRWQHFTELMAPVREKLTQAGVLQFARN